MNGMKKVLFFTAMMVALGMALTGCFRSTTQVEPTATPVPLVTEGATVMPGTTMMAGVENVMPGASVEPAQRYDWISQAPAIENRVNMFSEVQESSIVTSGTTALVGVTFTSQYKGEMTQRIRDMIAGEVMAADPSIQVVAVTAEQADVATIKQLSQQQRSGADQDQIRAEVERIARNATTLR